MINRRFFSCLLAGASAFAWAAAAQAQSLEGALVQAYAANPGLNAQRAATRAADENVPQALSGYRPSVIANADASFQRSSAIIKDVGRQNSALFPRGLGLQIDQTLFNGFRTGNSVRAAETGVLAQRELLRGTEQDTLLDAVTAYMDVLRDAATLNLENNNVEVLEEQLKQTQDQFDVGEKTRTDVEQAKASLAGARSQQLAAQANLKASTAVYRQVIGSEPKKLQPAKPIQKLLPKTLNGAIATGLASHPAVASALHGVDSAGYQVKIAEGALYPSLGASASVTQRWDVTGQTREGTDGSVGLKLTVPIFESGGVNYSKTRQAKEALGQKRIEADVAREQVRAAVVKAWGTLEASTAQIAANSAQVAASEVALNGVREEAKVGQRTTLDVLNAQQTLLNARVQLVISQRNRVVASYALLSAVGRLSAQRLGLRVASYDPTIHYDQVRDKWLGTSTPDGR